MKTRNEKDRLNEMIASLQTKQAFELVLLREQFDVAYKSLKPLNQIKNALREVATSPVLKSSMLDNVIGLTTGYLSKKVLVGTSHNPVKRILGALLQFAIANVVSKHTETIKATGGVILKRILKNKDENHEKLA